MVFNYHADLYHMPVSILFLFYLNCLFVLKEVRNVLVFSCLESNLSYEVRDRVIEKVSFLTSSDEY